MWSLDLKKAPLYACNFNLKRASTDLKRTPLHLKIKGPTVHYEKFKVVKTCNFNLKRATTDLKRAPTMHLISKPQRALPYTWKSDTPTSPMLFVKFRSNTAPTNASNKTSKGLPTY